MLWSLLSLFLWLGPWLPAGAFRSAAAGTPEPILFLGIQRHTAIDQVLSQQLIDYLSERGENILRSSALSDGERRCRQPSCLEALALDHHAAWVLSGDVSSTGPNNTLRVQARLFDVRHRGAPEAVSETENLCVDCDETKLGILISSTTSELIIRYRQTTPPPAEPPAPAQPGASPPAASDPFAGASPLMVPPLPPENPQAPPQQVSPPPASPQQAPVPPPPPPQAQVAPPPVASAPPPGYAPQQAPAPVLIPQPQQAPAKRHGLSRTRKAVAAAFGVAGFGALIVAGVMNGLDHRLAPDLSYDPSGKACRAPENAGKVCVLSTVGLYAPSYAIGGLLVGGMILTLAIPESHPRPPPPPPDDNIP